MYQEIKKLNWPFTAILGMVMRPGSLVDFTLSSKENAIKMAEYLRKSDIVRDVVAHAESVTEVRIDFIPPRFPTDLISEYLTSRHGEILQAPVRISDRYNIQTGTRVFKMQRKSLETSPIPSFLYYRKYKFRVRYSRQPTTCGYCAEEGHLERECPEKFNMIKLQKKTKLNKRQAPDENPEKEEQNDKPTHEEARNAFEREEQQPIVSDPSKPGDNTITNDNTDKRPKRNYSDTNSSCERESRRHKADHDDLTHLCSLFDPELVLPSSDETGSDTLEFDVQACCRDLIKKCKGDYFACACESRFFECKCGWKPIPSKKGVFSCQGCTKIIANCNNCDEFVFLKKKQPLKCYNCNYAFQTEINSPTEY